MDEELRGAPQQLDARALLLLLEEGDDLIQVFIRLPQRLPVRSHVAIVKGVERHPEFFRDFKKDRHARLGQIQPTQTRLPRANRGRTAKHIRALATHGMPVNDREAQMITHCLVLDDFVGMVVLKSEWILRFRTFVGNAGDVSEVLAHGC